jgi:hypothetical protein
VLGNDVLASFEELAEELLCRLLVPSPLDENSQHIPVLIHRTPQIVALLGDRDAHPVEGPFVARSGALALQLIRALLTECAAPLWVSTGVRQNSFYAAL